MRTPAKRNGVIERNGSKNLYSDITRGGTDYGRWAYNNNDNASRSRRRYKTTSRGGRYNFFGAYFATAHLYEIN